MCFTPFNANSSSWPVQGRVLVLERTKEAGKKVLMSGGTRCNVLPSEVDIDKVCAVPEATVTSQRTKHIF